MGWNQDHPKNLVPFQMVRNECTSSLPSHANPSRYSILHDKGQLWRRKSGGLDMDLLECEYHNMNVTDALQLFQIWIASEQLASLVMSMVYFLIFFLIAFVL